MRFRLFDLIGLAVLVAAIGLVALLVYRPAVLLSVNGAALSHSLEGEIGRTDLEGSCKERRDDEWVCAIGADRTEVIYEVTIGDRGCWDATKVEAGSAEGGAPDEASGCLNVLDYIRVF